MVPYCHSEVSLSLETLDQIDNINIHNRKMRLFMDCGMKLVVSKSAYVHLDLSRRHHVSG